MCARLIPQPDRDEPVDVAAGIDRRLAEGKGDGWRYDDMPPDGEAYTRGLQGLDELAQSRHGARFAGLEGAAQDAILRDVQRGEVRGGAWETLPARHFFEELLAEATERYYAHPLAQEEIGYVGMADAHGWQRIGLNEREPVENGLLRVANDLRAPRVTHDPSSFVNRQSSPNARRRRKGSAPDLYGNPIPMRTYPLREEMDAVVIGTGAGGAPLVARLAQAGLRVVALEAGRHWAPARDFATDEQGQVEIFWNDERLSAGGDPLPFGRDNSGCGVGGTTLHYTAYTPRPQPDNFHLHSEFGVGMDWPIGYAEREAYYDALERFLGVSGPSPYPWGPPRRQPYPLRPLPLNGAAQIMERGCRAVGIRTAPAANAALSGSYYQEGVGWRAACTNRGFCQTGCNTGAKASMDVTFIPLAIRAGAEVRAECFATRLERKRRGQIAAVIYVHEGREHRQACRSVFLCAGAIETPRLLLLNELANSSGQVGRNFMAHPSLQIWGQFEDEVRPYKGIPAALISEDTHRPTDADFAGG